jgi:RND family efflux transporter MFP subunit
MSIPVRPLLVALAILSLPCLPQAAETTGTRVAAPKTVHVVRPKSELWTERVEASGNIMPWNETRISTEIGGLRLASVLVGEGERVKKGQVLAKLDTASVETELDVANAQREEADAVLAQAAATLERANRLAPSGGVSRQELTLYETQKHTAEARLSAARAQVRRQQIRLELATLTAPDDGLISSCTATEGSIVPAGSELFRLIRQGRLEWHVEVPGETLLKLASGQEVLVKSPLGNEIKGRIRRLSPTVDLGTRRGLVYVELPQNSELKAGFSVSGSINLGKTRALVIPDAAIVRQDGNAKVFRIGANGRVEAAEITLGRHKGEWTEVLSGLDENSQIVGDDTSKLRDGETVKVLIADAAQP